MKGGNMVMTEFMVFPGEIIKEYLDEKRITQKELSHRTGISEKHISNVLNGRSRLTEDFALKLEKVMPEVPASYWLNYECKYREHVAREKEIYNLENTDLNMIAKKFRFKDVFKGLNLTITEQAVAMLKTLGISDFANFDAAFQSFEAEFMEDGGEREAIAIWMSLCKDEIEVQNEDLSNIQFSKAQTESNLQRLKNIANNDNLSASLKSCKKLCNALGIYFVICEAIPGCKVRGVLTTYKGNPAIFISCRFKKHDYVWFAIIHEIAHLLLHYQKNDTFISYGDDVNDSRDKEKEANQFTRDFFINPEDYREFIVKNVFTTAAIRNFAAQQKVTAAIVLGRLQHDGYLSYAQGSYLK